MCGRQDDGGWFESVLEVVNAAEETDWKEYVENFYTKKLEMAATLSRRLSQLRLDVTAVAEELEKALKTMHENVFVYASLTEEPRRVSISIGKFSSTYERHVLPLCWANVVHLDDPTFGYAQLEYEIRTTSLFAQDRVSTATLAGLDMMIRDCLLDKAGIVKAFLASNKKG